MMDLLSQGTELALKALAPLGAIALDKGLLALPTERKRKLVRVLVRLGPHRRGGRGDLGLHWVAPSGPEELLALVDVSRSLVWLMPREVFCQRAQPWPRGAFHLDWIVLPLGKRRSHWPQEEEWESYLVAGGDVT